MTTGALSLKFSTSKEDKDVCSIKINEIMEGLNKNNEDSRKIYENVLQHYLSKTVNIFVGHKVENELPFNVPTLIRFLQSKLLKNLKKLKLNDVTLTKENFNNIITEINKLEEIVLKNCDLTSVGKSFDDLIDFPELKILDLSDNQIIDFEINSTNVPHIMDLDLSGNMLRNISLVGNNFNIKFLSLHENALDNFPEEITSLTSLILLNLSQNNITSIPNNISNLINLSHLDLSHNKLKGLPSAFINLVNLKELYLNNNDLSTLTSMKPLTNLKKLDVSHNRISTLFSDITLLNGSNIEELVACDNKIWYQYNATLNQYYLPKLKILDISNNEFTTVLFIENFKNIEEVNVSHNKLHAFYIHAELSNITKIDASHNLMTIITPGLFNMYTLKSMNFSNNMITKIGEINNLPFLKHLDLKNNKIVEIPEFIKTMESLTEFNIANNPINVDNKINIEMINYITDLNNGKKISHQNGMTSYEMEQFQKLVEEITPRPNTPIPELVNQENKMTLANLNKKINTAFSNPETWNAGAEKPNYTTYETSLYDVEDIIVLRSTLINALRDFLTINHKPLEEEPLASCIHNNKYFHKSVIRTIAEDCNSEKIIDGIGKTFMDLMGHIFACIESKHPNDQEIIYKIINNQLYRYKGSGIEKHIECFVKSLEGLDEQITMNISDIENLISITIDVSKMQHANMAEKKAALKDKLLEGFYDSIWITNCGEYIK